jgi:hypothetical protein
VFRWERSVLEDIKWHRENKDCSENLKKVYEEIEGKLKKYKKSSVQKDEKVYCEITFFVGYQFSWFSWVG